MKAFVTGGTGLLGSNLVHTLVREGHSVRALVRDRKKAERLLGEVAGIDLVEGDMADVAAFGDAMAGCDVVFHTAAYFREYFGTGGRAAAELTTVNVEGSVRLMEEAHRRGVRLGIHTGSGGVVGVSRNGEPGNESTPPAPLAGRNLYFKSKLAAEERLRQFSETSGFPVIHILPGWMFGPGDAAPTSSGQLVLDFLARKLPGIIDGGTCVVDARDVARAMVDATQRGRAGERYLVAGEFTPLSEIVETLSKVSGVPAPRFRVPYGLSLAAAFVVQNVARMRGKPALLSTENFRTLHAKLQASSEKARRELGARFRPLEDTLRDEVVWFRGHVGSWRS